MEHTNFQHQKHINDPLDFFRERGGKVVSSEYGWCNYYIFEGSVGYLENLFIYPEHRKSQNGTSLLMRLETQLQELEKVEKYVTTISKLFPNHEQTKEICLKRGFSIYDESEDTIYLYKEF